MIKEEEFSSPSLAERETILRYDDVEHNWYIYTNVPKHIRRLESLLDNKQTIKKGFDPQSGRSTMIEGVLSKRGNIIFGKKPHMSQEQREKARQRLIEYLKKQKEK